MQGPLWGVRGPVWGPCIASAHALQVLGGGVNHVRKLYRLLACVPFLFLKIKKKQRKIREAALHLLWRGTFHYDEPRDYVGVIRTLNSKYQKFMTYPLVYNIY